MPRDPAPVTSARFPSSDIRLLVGSRVRERSPLLPSPILRAASSQEMKGPSMSALPLPRRRARAAAWLLLDHHGTLTLVDEPPAALPPEALAYYLRGREAGRLGEGHGLLELARTCEILERWLPAP